LTQERFSFSPGGEGKNGTPSDVNLTNAYWLAFASFVFYQDQGSETDVKKALHHVVDLDPIVFHWFRDDETSATAFYLRTSKVAILAFKGTNFADLHQYRILGDVGLETTEQGKTYSGFLSAFRRLWKEPGEAGAGDQSDIRAALLADQGRGRVPLYITGHSLGGAFATLASATMLHDPAFARVTGPPFAATYTFGAPRVGDAAFSADLAIEVQVQQAAFFRVVLDKDPVPSTLPANVLSHPGRKRSEGAAPATTSAATHEEDELVWLDPGGVAFFGDDGQDHLASRWINPVPSISDHLGYPASLHRYQ